MFSNANGVWLTACEGIAEAGLAGIERVVVEFVLCDENSEDFRHGM